MPPRCGEDTRARDHHRRDIDFLLDDELRKLDFDWSAKRDATGSREQGRVVDSRGHEHAGSHNRTDSGPPSRTRSRASRSPSPGRPRSPNKDVLTASTYLEINRRARWSPRKRPVVSPAPPRSASPTRGKAQVDSSSRAQSPTRSSAQERSYKTAAMMMQLKQNDMARRKNFRSLGKDLPLSVLDDNFAEQLRKFDINPLDIEDSNRGPVGSLSYLPDISPDEDTPNPLTLQPYTLWFTGVKMRFSRPESVRITKLWESCDVETLRTRHHAREKAVQSNLDTALAAYEATDDPPESEAFPADEAWQSAQPWLIAPNIWQDLLHEQTIELRKAEALRRRGELLRDMGEQGGRPATVAGQSRRVHAAAGTRQRAATALGDAEATSLPPQSSDGQTQGMTAMHGGHAQLLDEENTINRYSSGVFRNYLWRRGQRLPRPYTPTSHRWPVPKVRKDSD